MKRELLALAMLGIAACGSGNGSGGNPQPEDNGSLDEAPAGKPPALKIDCRHFGSGRDIQVGNPQPESGPAILQFASLGEVDWNQLAAGDTVRIFWRSEPYREKILIRGQGTAEQPIRLCGVPGPAGQLPAISGQDATSRPDLDFGDIQYGMEDLGVVTIYHRDYYQRPEHIVIEGLKITDTLGGEGRVDEDEFHYTATNGQYRPYLGGASCLRVQEGRAITVRGNELSNCGNGLFILSRPPESQMARDILVEGNSIHGNGATNSYLMHNAYLQGVDFLVQANRFGEGRPGSMGGNLKMRTAGDVVRYNFFAKAARILDFVEVQDHAELVLPWRFAEYQAGGGEVSAGDEERVAAAWAAYQKTYVYGNVILNQGPGASGSVVHYSYDNVQEDRRPGTLYFYNNTVVLLGDFEEQALYQLVDQGPWYGNSEPGFPSGEESFATVRAFHNVIYLGALSSGAQRSYFEFTRFRPDKLDLALGENWISGGWDEAIPGYGQAFPGFGNRCTQYDDCTDDSATYPGGNATHHVVGAAMLREGTAAPIDLQTYLPLPGSAPLAGSAWPGELSESYQPHYQIDPASGAISARPSLATLGAWEASF
ncbi:MAG TPA: hypothetical protein VJR29_05090 [bacterium]|nr:hypothetical protein [bacterium]